MGSLGTDNGQVDDNMTVMADTGLSFRLQEAGTIFFATSIGGEL
jgi:hypothetical protein